MRSALKLDKQLTRVKLSPAEQRSKLPADAAERKELKVEFAKALKQQVAHLLETVKQHKELLTSVIKTFSFPEWCETLLLAELNKAQESSAHRATLKGLSTTYLEGCKDEQLDDYSKSFRGC